MILLANEITLDKKAFDVLASETRINILKKLDSRRMTVSELSKILNLSKSAVYEHLEKLMDADFVKKNDDNNTNRVYYEITERGIAILHPHEKIKIITLLSSTVLAFVGGAIEIYRFVIGTVFRPLTPLPEPVIIHEPEHLILGLIMIACGVLFLYLTFQLHIHRKRKVKKKQLKSNI